MLTPAFETTGDFPVIPVGTVHNTSNLARDKHFEKLVSRLSF